MARGEYRHGGWPKGRAHTQVGVSLYHSTGDRLRYTEQMDTEFGALMAELVRKMGVDPALLTPQLEGGVDMRVVNDPTMAKKITDAYAKIEKSPLYPTYRDSVMPLYNEWNRFSAEHRDSTYERFKADWEQYEHWHGRIKQMRQLIQSRLAALGMSPLETPEPPPPPKTLPGAIVDTVADAGKKAGEAIVGAGSFLKYALYGTLAVVGAVAIGSIVTKVRDRRDPAEPFVALARRGRY